MSQRVDLLRAGFPTPRAKGAPREAALWSDWFPLVALPGAVLLFTPANFPRWGLMWLLALAIFIGCKWLSWRRCSIRFAAGWHVAGYLLAWPGLNANEFLGSWRTLDETLTAAGRPVKRDEPILAVTRMIAGAGLFWGVPQWIPADHEMLRGWIGMVGFVLMLHFGALDLISFAWRSAGVDARPLMDKPWRATSVGEFWGRRWNTAFRDFTHRFLFRPLSQRLGPRGAVVAGFIFSGLVHDLVISVPAGGGYGLPTLYFAIQGAAIFFERSAMGSAIGLGRGWRGWCFTCLILLAPAYGLFHPLFIHRVVVPFMVAMGGR